MTAFRQHPIFSSALALCALAAVAEGWFIYDGWRSAREAGAALERKKAELHAMAGVAPPPTRLVAAGIEADLARAEQALAAMAAELKGRGPAADRLRTARLPAARTDAYFDLATFVERTRALAQKQEIDVKPEAARFGFSAYANEGPDLDHIPTVFQQRLVAQYLIESLFEARPRSLLSVQRERMLTTTERAARDAAVEAARTAGEANGAAPEPVVEANFSSLPEGPDYFAIDPRASAAVPGHLDTTAFRIVFTGQTAVLRAFLNKLAGFELPVLVREVEVVPATGDEAAVAPPADEVAASEPAAASVVLTTDGPVPAGVAAKAPPRKSAATPIVAKPVSRFTVTVEYIVLVSPASARKTADGETAKPPA